ncbi:MAG: HAMP domain-containing protein [Actinobacteria bacterium]|nr:HAMP domain-containing protein [Actinomycetota bacterium]
MSPRRGIRLRITALATLAVAVVMLSAGLVLSNVQERLLTGNLDEILDSHSANLAEAVLAGRFPRVLEQQGSSDAIAQVVYADSVVVASTANLVGQRAFAPPDGELQRRTLLLPIDESRYRLLSRRVGDVVIHTGTPIDDVEEASAALRTGLAYGIPTVTLLLGILIWWLVGRTLRPVEAIRLQVAEMSGSNLDRRVPVPPTGDEIARLANTMNDMLARVQKSVERQQRFVADASHELRSPLTRVRTELEVDLDHPDTADTDATARSVLEEVDHLQRLVDDLLHLAGADGTETVLDQVVALGPLIGREVANHPNDRVRIDSSGLAVSSLAEANVVGDAVQLRRLVRNLLDNAVRHARSVVGLGCVTDSGFVRLTVDDDGAGIAEADRFRVFERFTRLDEARTTGVGGTGLGLAIAHDIVVRHGGSISVETSPLGGARFVVTLPASHRSLV